MVLTIDYDDLIKKFFLTFRMISFYLKDINLHLPWAGGMHTFCIKFLLINYLDFVMHEEEGFKSQNQLIGIKILKVMITVIKI